MNRTQVETLLLLGIFGGVFAAACVAHWTLELRQRDWWGKRGRGGRGGGRAGGDRHEPFDRGGLGSGHESAKRVFMETLIVDLTLAAVAVLGIGLLAETKWMRTLLLFFVPGRSMADAEKDQVVSHVCESVQVLLAIVAGVHLLLYALVRLRLKWRIRRFVKSDVAIDKNVKLKADRERLTHGELVYLGWRLRYQGCGLGCASLINATDESVSLTQRHKHRHSGYGRARGEIHEGGEKEENRDQLVPLDLYLEHVVSHKVAESFRLAATTTLLGAPLYLTLLLPLGGIHGIAQFGGTLIILTVYFFAAIFLAWVVATALNRLTPRIAALDYLAHDPVLLELMCTAPPRPDIRALERFDADGDLLEAPVDGLALAKSEEGATAPSSTSVRQRRSYNSRLVARDFEGIFRSPTERAFPCAFGRPLFILRCIQLLTTILVLFFSAVILKASENSTQTRLYFQSREGIILGLGGLLYFLYVIAMIPSLHLDFAIATSFDFATDRRVLKFLSANLRRSAAASRVRLWDKLTRRAVLVAAAKEEAHPRRKKETDAGLDGLGVSTGVFDSETPPGEITSVFCKLARRKSGLGTMQRHPGGLFAADLPRALALLDLTLKGFSFQQTARLTASPFEGPGREEARVETEPPNSSVVVVGAAEGAFDSHIGGAQAPRGESVSGGDVFGEILEDLKGGEDIRALRKLEDAFEDAFSGFKGFRSSKEGVGRLDSSTEFLLYDDFVALIQAINKHNAALLQFGLKVARSGPSMTTLESSALLPPSMKISALFLHEIVPWEWVDAYWVQTFNFSAGQFDGHQNGPQGGAGGGRGKVGKKFLTEEEFVRGANKLIPEARPMKLRELFSDLAGNRTEISSDDFVMGLSRFFLNVLL